MTFRIIAGQFKGRILKAPKNSSTRPTQGVLREAVFNICQNEIEGARFLDLFAGSGAMGLEALSRGAAHATFVDNDKQALTSIRENIAILQIASRTAVIANDAIFVLKRLFSSCFDIVYIDPPYDVSIIPFVEELLAHRLLAPNGLLFIEERYRRDYTPLSSSSLSQIGKARRFGNALLHVYISCKKTPTF